jgi:hypothetical protein
MMVWSACALQLKLVFVLLYKWNMRNVIIVDTGVCIEYLNECMMFWCRIQFSIWPKNIEHWFLCNYDSLSICMCDLIKGVVIVKTVLQTHKCNHCFLFHLNYDSLSICVSDLIKGVVIVKTVLQTHKCNRCFLFHLYFLLKMSLLQKLLANFISFGSQL